MLNHERRANLHDTETGEEVTHVETWNTKSGFVRRLQLDENGHIVLAHDRSALVRICEFRNLRIEFVH